MNRLASATIVAATCLLASCATMEADRRFCEESPDRPEAEKAMAALGKGQRDVTLSAGAANFYSKCRHLYDPMTGKRA